MGWNADVLVALIKANAQLNNERVLMRKGAAERMQKRTENALKFIKKKEKITYILHSESMSSSVYIYIYLNGYGCLK